MADIPDLWPSEVVEAEAVLTPFTILKTQAAALGPKTNGLVEAKVVRGTNIVGVFMYIFRLTAPSLNYSYELFTAYHDVIKLYPIYCTFLQEKRSCESQEQLMEWLKGVFASEETKRVLNGLLIQAKEGAPVD